MDILDKTDSEIENYIKDTLAYNLAVPLKGTFADYSTESLHSHSFHQLLMIPKGVSLLRDEYSSQILFGMQCAFIPAGRLHRSTVIGGEVGYQSLYIRKTAIESEERSIRIFPVSILTSELFIRLGSYKKISKSGKIENKIFNLLLDLIREESLITNFIRALPSPKTESGRKIVLFIESNFGRNISLNDFRNAMPYSVRHISRLFISDCGITIFEYLRAYRLMMASTYLLNEKRKILDTAYSCGYMSISSFYTDFRHFFGISPLEFVKKHIE